MILGLRAVAEAAAPGGVHSGGLSPLDAQRGLPQGRLSVLPRLSRRQR